MEKEVDNCDDQDRDDEKKFHHRINSSKQRKKLKKMSEDSSNCTGIIVADCHGTWKTTGFDEIVEFAATASEETDNYKEAMTEPKCLVDASLPVRNEN